MIRKLANFLFAAVVVLSLGTRADAAQGDGKIHVSLDAGELAVTNGAMTLYTVGLPAEEGYRITETFGGGIVKAEDASSPHLAMWLADAAGDTGKTINLDVDGNVTFSNLEEGLYLLVQTQQMDGFHPVKPFLVIMPAEGQQEIWACPKTDPIIVQDNPQTGEPIAPLLGAMGMVASGVGIYLCIDSRKKK